MVVMLISCTNNSLAQTESKLSNQIDTTIYDLAEVMPEFPNGGMAMMEFIRENFKLPNSNICIDVKTKYCIEYIVETDGTISNVKPYKNKSDDNSLLTQELIRVVKLFPKHSPAKQDNRFVRARLVVPLNIDFK